MKREDIITNHFITYYLDLLAVTETWLSERHGDDDLLSICSAGYSGVHSPRPSGRRGGGVALIYRDSHRIQTIPVGFASASFEYLVSLLQCNSISLRVVVVYRPPSQSTKCSGDQVLAEFSDFLQLLTVTSGKLLIVGDFNIHVDVSSNSTASKFLSLLDSFGFSQHVGGPTH